MTHQTAKEWLCHRDRADECFDLLEQIYSDFKLELEAEYKRGQDSVLNRTCEGCVHGKFGVGSNGVEVECDEIWHCNRATVDKWEQR